MTFTHLHHVGVMMPDHAPLRDLLEKVFGFPQLAGEPREGTHVDSDNVQIINVPVDDTLLEINKPLDDVSGSARWMAKKGPGIHHICFYTDDIDADTQRCVDAGLQLTEGPSGSPDQKGGSRASFFHPKSTAGILIELWQDMPE
jgi:methylmalonyl-CoA/ethylmalonyl-CoA epimerase